MTLLLAAAMAEIPAGATIDEAVAVQVTPSGFDNVGALLPELAPESTAIDDTSDSGGWQCLNYEYSLANMNVGVTVDDTRIIPGNGVLDVEVDLTVSVNDATDPFALYFELFCSGTDCPGYIQPFPVTVMTDIALKVVEEDGERVLDATIGDISYDNGLQNTDIQLDCGVQDLETVLNWFGLSLYDLMIGAIEGALDDQLADLRSDLETTVEEVFVDLSIEEEFEVEGAIVRLGLEPYDVDVTPDGLTLVMSGSADADPAECIADYDSGSSPSSDGPYPSPSTVQGDAGIHLSDDFTNQLLYAVWRGGLLCQVVDEELFPLDSGILGLLTGNVFDELFPGDEVQPAFIVTYPKQPLGADFTGDHDIDIPIRDLEIAFYSEVDGRTARVVSLDTQLSPGADLVFDGATGQLEVGLDIGADDMLATTAYNEFAPGRESEIEAGFLGSIGGILDTALGAVLPDLSFGLPAFEGVGMTSLDASGSEQWMTLTAGVGEVAYEASDCDDGCSGGCASGPAGLGVWALLAVGVSLRRRG